MPLPIFTAVDRRQVAHAVLLAFCKEEDVPPPWTTGAAARDSDGDPVEPTSWDAVAWSLHGMIRRCVAERAADRSIELSERERAEAERELLACFVHFGLRRNLPLRPENYEQVLAAFNDTPGLPFSDVVMAAGRAYLMMIDEDTTADLRTVAGRVRPDA